MGSHCNRQREDCSVDDWKTGLTGTKSLMDGFGAGDRADFVGGIGGEHSQEFPLKGNQL